MVLHIEKGDTLSEHYFSERPQSKHDLKTLSYSVPNSDQTLTLQTDAGVFSKSKVDHGSDLMIKTCIPTPGSKVLDMGCGYGVIGLSLKVRDQSLRVFLSDINKRAVELTRLNATGNNVEVEVINSNGFEKINEKFDYILINPPIRAGKKVINTILTDSKDYLLQQGELFVVIRKRQGAPSLQRFCQDLYGNCQKISKSAGYWILKSVQQ